VVNPMRAMGVSREIPCAVHIMNPGAPAFLSACGRGGKAREGEWVESTRDVKGKKP
jgi:hypothetical protein